jgi:serine/threonine protein kinase
MGEVYRATDTNLKRQVAIKVLPASVAADAERLARFQREAEILAALNHPNIAHIHGLEKTDGTLALVMELVEGPTLADRIAQGAIPLAVALPIAKQIAEAIEAAHEQGIIHRDLKPANIKVRSDGTVKVLDFGLAKAMEPVSNLPDASRSTTITSPPMTAAGVILGTAAYMSPEQARGGPVDKRTDIWAFGCVLYEMLTGRAVFSGKTTSDTIAAILGHEPDWARLSEATPAGVRLLLQRCLNKESRQRLRDIGDARIELEHRRHDQPAGSAGSAWRRRALPRIAWAGCGAGAAFALLVGVVHFRETPPAPPVSARFQISLPANVRLSTDGNFSLSPDGNSLVYFAAGSDGVMRLWVQAARDSLLEPRPLPGTEHTGGAPPFWSPDSRYVVFESQQALKKADLIGSPPERICDVSGIVLGGSWNRDGVIIFGTDTSGVWQVPAAGGVATALTVLDRARSERVNGFPTFLPDGRHFLYSRLSAVNENSGVYVGSLDAKPEEQARRRLMASPFAVAFVPSPDSNVGELLVLRESTLMAQHFDASRLEFAGDAVPVAEGVGSNIASGFFAASADGLIYRRAIARDSQLTWFDRQGKVLGTEGEPFLLDSGLRLSPKADRASLGRFDGRNIDIWISEFARGIVRLTSDPGLKAGSVWSPDGKYVAFSSSRAGHYDLFVKASNGDGPEELLFASGENKYPSGWSADGRFLLYFSVNGTTKSDLWVLPMAGAAKGGDPFIFLRTDAEESMGVFSPDSLVAYKSDESGSGEVYVRPFTPPTAAGSSPAGPKRPVSRGGGTEPRWRRDGRELFYMAPDGSMMAVAVTPQAVFGVPQRLFQLSINLSWDVDSTGTRFLFAIPSGQTAPPFTVVRNWQRTSTK